MNYSPYYNAYQPMPYQQVPYANSNNNYNSSDNSFIGVSCEQDARSYPVGLGKSVTFRDESLPNTYYTKTMGSSPLDAPTFEVYRLVKVDTPTSGAQGTETASKDKDIDLSVYALKDDLKPILTQINNIQKDIQWLREKVKKKTYREVEDDE